MKRTRLSIAGLMGIVGIAALGFAALRNATALWASVMFMIAVTLMATALVGTAVSRGLTRKAWAGFAIFGWVYLGIVFGPLPNGNGTTIPVLPTMVLYEYIYNANISSRNNVTVRNTHQVESLLADNKYPYDPTRTGNVPTMTELVNLMHLKRVVHSLSAILFALMGGLLGTILACRDERTSTQTELQSQQ